MINWDFDKIYKELSRTPNPIQEAIDGLWIRKIKGENTMDKKPKFKVGDKVIILDGSKIEHYTGGWATTHDGMKKLIGAIGTISRIIDGYGDRVGYALNESVLNAYVWDERGLKLASPNYKAVITSDGKTTTARYYENEKKVSEAKSVCHEEDEFDFNTGAVIALTRAVKGIDNVEVCIKDEVEEPKETEWDKFKKDKISFVVYQKDIKSFLDACVSDNIKWRVNDKPADDVSEDKWKEWLSFPSIYFRIFPSQIGGGLTWGGFPNCNCSEWLKSLSFVRWNPSDPNHNPTK